jgi:competence protein ComEC
MKSIFKPKKYKSINVIGNKKSNQSKSFRHNKKRKSGNVGILALTTITLFSLLLSLQSNPSSETQVIQYLNITNSILDVERNNSISLEFDSNIVLNQLKIESIECTSSNKDVAIIVNRKVFAFSVGESTINCSLDGIESESIFIKVIQTEINQPSDSDNQTVDPIEQPQSPGNPPNPSNPTTPTNPTEPVSPNNPITPPDSNSTSQKLIVSYIDVGQGDSILIQTPQGRNILIDAGTSTYGPIIAQHLRSRGINKIDVLIATHPHADHIGGMAYIIQNFEIGSIYMPKASTTTQTFENLLLTIQSKGLNINTARAGVILNIDSTITAKFIAPISDNYNDLNQFSAVLRITYQSTSFLFAGDAGQLSENQMLSSGDTLRSDVLKVGHHGSSTSTSQNFLNSVNPSIAIISVGEGNRYGHPTQEVLNRLLQLGATIYRTDVHGTIIIVSDGKFIKIEH